MNLIQQHSFDITCSSQEIGKEIHTHLSSLLEKYFYPQLDILLHKYAYQNHSWHIDLLNIELPNISKKYWKRELIQKSLSQIEEYLKNNYRDQEEPDHLAEAPIHFISKNNHAQHLFFHFLKKGKISENTISKDLEKIVFEIDIDASFIQKLTHIFESDNHFLIRWLFSVPAFFKEQVFKEINGFTHKIKKEVAAILNNKAEQQLSIQSFIKKINKNSLHKNQWLEFVQWICFFQKKGNSKEVFFKEFKQFSEEFFEITPKELWKFSQFMIDTNHKRSTSITKKSKLFFQTLHKSFQLDSTNKEFKDRLDVSDAKQQIKLNKSQIKTDSINYINNAGIILLHPFFKTLFVQLDLCENDGIWKNKKSQHKAILLTQYLVKSEEKINESDLILNKILCGLAIEKVVNVTLKISKKEKDKCNNLLEAILEYWKVMHSSSIEALQETFLQRDAKLKCIKDNSYEVWVEEKGVDILLEQLPWGIATIQTPWMVNYLTCHWS
jgi:hypothetical protein